jgi:hypothetical protein
MPLPHEQAAINAAQGARKERLIEAALVLDRIRAEYPGLDNADQLPGPVRREALAAVAAFRGRGSFDPSVFAAVLMLVVGSAALLLSPLRVFRCEPGGQGLVTCRVSELVLGLWTLREEKVPGIAAAEAGSHLETSESRDSQGRTRTTTTRVTELVFKDAHGSTLWRTSGSHFLGAPLEGVSEEVSALLSEERAAPFVRAHEAWPPLLLGSLFVIIGLSTAGSSLGLALRNRGFIGPTLYTVAFYWGPLLLAALVCAAGWAIAFVGNDPPAMVIDALRLG